MSASMYESVVAVVSKPPEKRQDREIQALLFWFRRRSQLFKSIKIDILADIVRNCEFMTRVLDEVIIKQGEQGNSFYIILRGSVSIYISATLSELEEGESLEEKQLTEAYTEEGALDRSKFGNFIANLESGYSFGELALINKNCVRNASIISDEVTDLLVVNRELYNRCLKAAQSAELEEKMAFVWSHPLFRNWATKHKKQMSYSLRKEKITFNEHIVKQGEHASAMYFLLRGSARVSIEPSSHESQYPQFYPLEDPDDIVTREELQLENQYVSVMNKKRENSTLLLPEGKVNMSPSEIRRKEKSLKKQVEVRTITAVEVIGELEFLLDLKTYFQSAICTESCDVFALDIKNYERLLVKRNPRSVALLRDLIELKTVCHLARLHDDQVPLLRTLLFRLKNFQRKKTRQTVRQNGDIRAGAFESSPRGGPPRFTTRTHTNLHETHSRLLNNSLSMGLLSSNLTHHSKDSGNKPGAYGHSLPGSSPFITHEASARYKGSPEGGKEEREIDYFDAASSDRVLSILEARIREWHTTINEDVLLHSPPVSKRETLAPIPLHRFTHKKGKEIKPGTKIVVRRKLQTFQPPKPDEKPPTETPSEPETLPVTSRSTMISPLLKAKAGHGQKYTKEDYRELKRLLQQQQRVYTGSTDKV